jgi:hypothetical protein
MPVQTPVEIFGTPHSNFVRAVRVAIAEKGLPYKYHPVRPHSPEARAVHPLGLVRRRNVELLCMLRVGNRRPRRKFRQQSRG